MGSSPTPGTNPNYCLPLPCAGGRARAAQALFVLVDVGEIAFGIYEGVRIVRAALFQLCVFLRQAIERRMRADPHFRG